MATKPMKVPGPEHPISIEKEPARIVVKAAGRTLVDTRAALTLREADYPPVYYIPRADVDMSLLTRTKHVTYCPYKGKCNYYSVAAGGARSLNAVWDLRRALRRREPDQRAHRVLSRPRRFNRAPRIVSGSASPPSG